MRQINDDVFLLFGVCYTLIRVIATFESCYVLKTCYNA
jgi:hypothetical protein